MGYYRAGFDILGVDILPQPRYPFPFVQWDALEFPLEGFDAIHASPPCQSYSKALRHMAIPQPMLIDAARDRLTGSGVPWVIENVVGAPLRAPVELCGTMFGLRIYRHRLFETSFAAVPAAVCDHTVPAMNPFKAAGMERIYAEFGRSRGEARWREEMGVPWMSKHGAREAIPPVFTEYIGWFLQGAVSGKG